MDKEERIKRLHAAGKAKREANKAAGIKTVIRNAVEKLKDNPKSLRASVNAMCFQCMGDGYDSGWKWGVGNCTSPDCGLYAVRPYQNKEGKPAEGVYNTGVE